MNQFFINNKRKILATAVPLLTSVITLFGIKELNEIILPNWGIWRYVALFVLFLIAYILLLILEYHIYKSKVKYFSDRDNAPYHKNLSKILENCDRRILLASIAGRSLTHGKGIEDILVKLINKKIEIKILTSDPECEFVKLRQVSESNYTDANSISERIKEVLTKCRDIRDKVDPKKRLNFGFLTNSNIIGQSILIIDDLMFVVPYLYKIEGAKSPVIEINKKHQPELFKSFESNFWTLWEKGSEPEERFFYSQKV